MIMEAELPVLQEAITPELMHWICMCRENVALCGLDVTNETLYQHDEYSTIPACPDCVKVDSAGWVCPVCLYGWDEERD